jgi:predicted transcriptional regulator
MREVAQHAGVARAVTALYRAYKDSVESMRALATKVYDGRDFQGLDPSHLPSEEVSDVIQHHMNFFPELELAAEGVASRAQLDRRDLFRGLVDILRDQHNVEVIIASPSRNRGAVRIYDPQMKRLVISELLPMQSRTFQLAHQIGLLSATREIDTIITRSHLTTPDSVKLCRVALASYFAGALIMPYELFLSAAEEMRYDIELLSHRFGASFEQVCHRLTTMRKPGRAGVSFHFVRVDIAGNISKKFSGTGIRFARFSGSCPRWDVHAAFLTPERIRTQVSKMPDGTAYFCVARTIHKSYGGYNAPQTLMAVGLGCTTQEARKLVYADGIDLDNLDAAVPIGTTCRLCERVECEQRAFPAIQHGISLDENIRGTSFYAPPFGTEPPATPALTVKKRKPRATP